MTVLSGGIAPSALGKPPSYIRVMSDEVDVLPPLEVRNIDLPDGSRVRVLHENSFLYDQHRSQCATLRASAENVLAAGYGQGDDALAAKWFMFRGINWEGNPSGGRYMMTMTGMSGGEWWADIRYGQYPGQPEHILFLQCSAWGDPLDTGTGYSTLWQMEGQYIGWLGSVFDGFITNGGAESTLIYAAGIGRGPYHFEGNDFRMPGSFTIMTGGGGSSSVGVVPSDWVYRRNWHHAPPNMREADINSQGQPWVVNIGGGSYTSVDYVSGRGWWVDGHSPSMGGIMYAPSTGKARKIGWTTAYAGGQYTNIPLQDSWGQAATGLEVYFQQASPSTKYNSGLDTPMPTASTTAGSVRVNLSAPLPASCLVGDKFYLNNLHFNGVWFNWNNNLLYSAVGGAYDNGWSSKAGMVDASGVGPVSRQQCRRKKIVAIDPVARMWIDLEYPYWETNTFPYTVSVFDGLVRTALYFSKGAWECKVGDRMCMEGNVFDYTPSCGTAHPTTQPNPWGVGTGVVSGNTVTLQGGATWPSSGFTSIAAKRKAFGHPWPYLLLISGYSGSDIWGSGRIIDEITGPSTATLVPIDPGLTGQFGDGTYSLGVNVLMTPFWKWSNYVSRYNIKCKSGRTSNFNAHANMGETDIGYNYIWHDELHLFTGALDQGGGAAPMTALNIPNAPLGLIIAGEASRSADLPKYIGNGSYLRWSHNAMLHQSGVGFATFAYVGGGADPKVRMLEFADNVGVDLGHTVFASSPATLDQEAGTGSVEEPTLVRRNVLAGPYNLVTGTAFGNRWPDNTPLANDPSLTGMADYHATQSGDYLDLNNYRLHHIFATGTVSIASDGLSATLASGSFPSTVVAGQFFRTESAVTELRKITSVAGGNTVHWASGTGPGQGAHPEAGQSGRSYAVTFINTGSDGQTPGPDYDLLEAFTRGVKRDVGPW